MTQNLFPDTVAVTVITILTSGLVSCVTDLTNGQSS